MLYLVAIFIAIVIGTFIGIKKGRRFDISCVKFEKIWLVIIAFGVQSITRIMGFKGITILLDYSLIINGIVFALLFTCLWYNRKYAGLWIVGAGAFLNALVMMVNNGKMPVSAKILEEAQLIEAIDMLNKGMNSKHVIIDEATRLGFLADIIHLPGFLGVGILAISIGDLFVAVGIFVFVLELFKYSYRHFS
ncbi:UNVERIFIED_CONTAM: hypothetical protein Cloal_3903 [Acetivibrio alkalicellulosi]